MPQEVSKSSTMTLPSETNIEAANNGSVDNLFKRSGGAYIPPGRLRLMQQQQLLDNTTADSEVAQRIAWDALKRSINGLINKVNASNIKAIIPELFAENLVRGKGLFCKSIMRAQSLATPFTPVYASLAAVINSKLPEIGELLLKRIVYQFQRAYRRNDRVQCISLVTFIAHLVNHQVANEFLVLQVIGLLLERPTADSVELAVGLTKECGHHLAENTPRALNIMFDQFRDILHQGDIDKRVQYMVEVLFQVRKDKFKDNPAIPAELDLVEDEDRIIHEISLHDDDKDENGSKSSTNKHTELFGMDFFKVDPDYLQSQKMYEDIKKEILGSDDEDEEDEGGSESEESDEDDEEEEQAVTGNNDIVDKTGTNITNLRRSIYLTIMSSGHYEEASHKLLSMKIAPEDEVVLCSMIIDCCAQERSYLSFYGQLVERFCKLARKWAEHFEFCFKECYESIHRYDSNKLRNVSTLFGHLFSNYALPLPALSVLEVNEETSTVSSRIFIKQILLEMAGILGYPQLNAALKDPDVYPAIQPSMFPTNSIKAMRFAINYYTAIGLSGLNEELRNAYEAQNLREQEAKQLMQNQSSFDSDSSSESSSDSDSNSDSDSSASDSESETSSHRRSRHRRKLNSRSVSPRRSSSHRSRDLMRQERSPSPANYRKPSRRSPSPVPRSIGHRHRSPSVSSISPGRHPSRRSPSPVRRTTRERRRSPSSKRGDSDKRSSRHSPSPISRTTMERRRSPSADSVSPERYSSRRTRSSAGRSTEYRHRSSSVNRKGSSRGISHYSRSPVDRSSRVQRRSPNPGDHSPRDRRRSPSVKKEMSKPRRSLTPVHRTSMNRRRSPSSERKEAAKTSMRRSPSPVHRSSANRRRSPSTDASRSPARRNTPSPLTTNRQSRRNRSQSLERRSPAPKRRSTRRSLSRSLTPPSRAQRREIDSPRKLASGRDRPTSRHSNSSGSSLSPYSRRRLL